MAADVDDGGKRPDASLLEVSLLEGFGAMTNFEETLKITDSFV